MQFRHTQEAAKAEKQSKWDLIEAIAIDAVDNEVSIAGVESQLEASKACAAVGNEHADNTVRNLCKVAEFDYESTNAQRKTWRTYGWTIIGEVANAGWSQEQASAFLAGARRTFREVRAEIARHSDARRRASYPQDPNVFWHAFITKLDKLLTDAAGATDHYGETNDELDVHAALARLVYERLTESKIDTELRELLESEAAQ